MRTRVGLATLATVAVTSAVLIVTPAGETVATFVDRSFGSSVFSTSKLKMQGNATADVTEGSPGWSDHSSENEAAEFQPSIGEVIPGSTRSYSRFGLRLTPESAADASVTMSAGTQLDPSTYADKFRMRVVRSKSTTCDATSFSGGGTFTFIVGSAGTQPTNFGTMLAEPNSNKQFPLAAEGTPVFLCYEFSLPTPPPTGLPNGTTTTVLWDFSAESVTP